MIPHDLEWLKFYASIATPVILLVLGLKINRTLEKNKVQIAKDKEWKNEWAKRFYAQAISYNESIEDVIMALHAIQQESNEKKSGWDKRINEFEIKVREAVLRLQKAEWSLITICEFCPNSKNEVLYPAKQAFNQLSEILACKHGNLEEIRKSLHLFNAAAMKAHREILG